MDNHVLAKLDLGKGSKHLLELEKYHFISINKNIM